MKKIRNSSLGSGLVDYVIPTAVVGIILGLAIYNLYKSGNLQGFIEASVGGNVSSGELIINQ